MLLDQVRDPQQQPCPFRREHSGPLRRYERGGGRLNGGGYVGCRALGELGEHLASGRIPGDEGFALGARRPLAADEHFCTHFPLLACSDDEASVLGQPSGAGPDVSCGWVVRPARTGQPYSLVASTLGTDSSLVKDESVSNDRDRPARACPAPRRLGVPIPHKDDLVLD